MKRVDEKTSIQVFKASKIFIRLSNLYAFLTAEGRTLGWTRTKGVKNPVPWLPNEAFYVGSRMHSGQSGLLCDSHRLHPRLRTPRPESREVAMELILLGLVTIALLVYLVYALLQPEKF